MLRFIPIQQPQNNSNLVSSSGRDDWLTNADESLLNQVSDDLQDTIAHLQSPQEQRTFKLEQLDLTPLQQSCEITLENGEKVLLQDKDILQLPWVSLQILVVHVADETVDAKQTNTPPSMIATHYQDIWSEGLQASEPRKKIIDPFQDAAPLVPMKHAAHRNSYYTPANNALPAGVIPQTVNTAYDNMSVGQPVNQSITGGDILNSLAVDSQMHHVSTPSIPAPMQVDRQPQLSEQLAMQANQINQAGGNVLRDLGINEQATVLPSSVSGGKQRTFMEQSPLDLINDCWDEVDFGSQQAVSAAFIAPTNMMQTTPTVKQSLKSLARKIFD